MWEIEYFENSNGRIPTEEFLDGLSKKTELPYVLNALEQLGEHGHDLKRPQVDYLGKKIYELRVKTLNRKIRLLYFFFDGNKIIITHGLIKKTLKVPPSEIALAIDYMNIYLQRNGNRK